MSIDRRLRFILIGSLVLSAGCGSPTIPESSGLARSVAHPERLWTHNDGPNALATDAGDNHLYLLDGQGQLLSKVAVNAPNSDWEDMAAFRAGEQGYLLIAAVGDNAEGREVYELHAVKEPRDDQTSAEVEWTVRFRFPDGSHDCEAVAVDPVDGAVILLTKRAVPAGVYRLPLGPAEPGGPAVLTAERLGTLWAIPRPGWRARLRNPLQGPYSHQPTALAISGDGRSAVISTYDNAYLWRRPEGAGWGETFARRPVTVGLPGIRQYEGIAFAHDGSAVFVSREGSDELLHIPLPSL